MNVFDDEISKANGKKVCPIRMIIYGEQMKPNSVIEKSLAICLGEKCAWYDCVTNKCAVVAAIDTIDSLGSAK